LAKFYDIHGFEYWGRTYSVNDSTDDTQSDDSDSDNVARDQLLQNAVQDYPSMAWEEVALRIGVKEHNFNPFYERATELALRPQLPITKRQPQQVESSDGGDVKRSKKKIEMHEFDRSESRPSTSDPSDVGRIRYGTPSTAARARETLIRKMREGPLPRTLSGPHTDDSPTEVISSVERLMKAPKLAEEPARHRGQSNRKG
jgi:hypothetical protein